MLCGDMLAEYFSALGRPQQFRQEFKELQPEIDGARARLERNREISVFNLLRWRDNLEANAREVG